MSLPKAALTLYVINLALLITHEIDSAFWHEWDLFGLPGGIDGFLVLNFILVIIFLYGLKRLAGGYPAGRIFSVVLAAAGLFAFSIHMLFLGKGHQEFNTAVSITILVLTLIVSLAQITVIIFLTQKQ